MANFFRVIRHPVFIGCIISTTALALLYGLRSRYDWHAWLSCVYYVNYNPTKYLVSWIPGLARLIDRVVLPGGAPLTAIVLWLVPAALWSTIIYAVYRLYRLGRYLVRRRPLDDRWQGEARLRPCPSCRRVGTIIGAVSVALVVAVAMLSSLEYGFENPCGNSCWELTRNPVGGRWKSDKDITDFVASRKGLVTKAIDFSDSPDLGIFTEKGYAMLASIEGLEAIVITGCYKTFDPIPLVKLSGDYAFRSILTDEKFAELLRIPGLKCIVIWYGSLSSDQRRLLHERLPDCCLHENVNKC